MQQFGASRQNMHNAKRGGGNLGVRQQRLLVGDGRQDQAGRLVFNLILGVEGLLPEVALQHGKTLFHLCR